MYYIKCESWNGSTVEVYRSIWKWIAVRKFKRLDLDPTTCCRWLFLCKDDRTLECICKAIFF